MSGFADLVPKAQPALFGGGFAAAATKGRTWLWEFTDVTDDNGDPIGLSTGVTATCKVLTAPGGTEIISLTATLGDGEFAISADETATAAISQTPGNKGLVCYWYLILDDGTDEVQVWSAHNSKFLLESGV